MLCEDFPQPGVVSSYLDKFTFRYVHIFGTECVNSTPGQNLFHHICHPIVFFTGLHVKDSDMEEERRGGGSGGVKAALKFLRMYKIKCIVFQMYIIPNILYEMCNIKCISE